MKAPLFNDELSAIYEEMAAVVATPRRQDPTLSIQLIADAVKTLAWHIDQLRQAEGR